MFMATHRLYAFLITGLIYISLGCHRAPVIPVENQPKRPVALDGKQWLEWQSSGREDFVMAYIGGYSKGVRDACVLHDLDPYVKPGHPGDCSAKAPRYSLKSDSAGNVDLSAYTNVLTKFYTEHPEYQSISYVLLMPYLTDEQHKTADDLYNMAKTGKIRTSGMGLGSGTVPGE
jgi:hypothetical protein